VTARFHPSNWLVRANETGLSAQLRSHPGATQTEYLRYVELKLSGDTALLADALQTERPEKASSTLYRDYLLSMATPPLPISLMQDSPACNPAASTPAAGRPEHRCSAGLSHPAVAIPRRLHLFATLSYIQEMEIRAVSELK
jgi:hypothetical protein